MRRVAKRRKSDGQPYAPNPWHDFLMDVYSCAAQAWWLQAEAVALGYDTELAEFKLHTPHPQLRGFMVELSATWREQRGATAPCAGACAGCSTCQPSSSAA